MKEFVSRPAFRMHFLPSSFHSILNVLLQFEIYSSISFMSILRRLIVGVNNTSQPHWHENSTAMAQIIKVTLGILSSQFIFLIFVVYLMPHHPRIFALPRTSSFASPPPALVAALRTPPIPRTLLLSPYVYPTSSEILDRFVARWKFMHEV